MKVAKWGNSLAVRLPAAVVEALGLREGDEVQIKAADGQLTLQRAPDTDELWARLHALREKLPPDFRFDREDANARDRDEANALIVAAAQRAGAHTLYTEDMQHGRAFDGLRLVHPFEAA